MTRRNKEYNTVALEIERKARMERHLKELDREVPVDKYRAISVVTGTDDLKKDLNENSEVKQDKFGFEVSWRVYANEARYAKFRFLCLPLGLFAR